MTKLPIGCRKLDGFDDPIFGSLVLPGCLKSESEERETWTAESLRVLDFGGVSFRDLGPDEDFGGTRFKGTPWFLRCEARGFIGGTSSNVVISRFKVQVQLESLILAQSERWRQA